MKCRAQKYLTQVQATSISEAAQNKRLQALRHTGRAASHIHTRITDKIAGETLQERQFSRSGFEIPVRLFHASKEHLHEFDQFLLHECNVHRDRELEIEVQLDGSAREKPVLQQLLKRYQRRKHIAITESYQTTSLNSKLADAKLRVTQHELDELDRKIGFRPRNASF